MRNYIKAEFYKMRHTSFYFLHILLPLLAAGIFLFYYAMTGYDSEGEVSIYIQVLGITLPFIVSLVCSITMENEEKAAHYYHLFGNLRGSSFCFLAKYLMLLMNGLLAEIIAVFVFNTGYILLGVGKGLPFGTACVIILLQFISMSGLYLIHLLLELYGGKGVSLAVGGVESLVAALFVTILGDRLWIVAPCSYGVRIPLYYLMGYWKMGAGIFCILVSTALIGILSHCAVLKYER